eukprot:gnl/MRDRNA2_/MRDRNA2_81825_c0_seq1.p1 gnl/MRDRNA2_/MRDRNA2_81825_c0~~gnl/MRDRNA2_/MRDRNA2_81825_c0_seq1.p1  ORF type:complete len:737 (-),score=156.13 gnl/MRDRNA2_/MRDRNA2_81825_c0_seq1:222-2396(-)
MDLSIWGIEPVGLGAELDSGLIFDQAHQHQVLEPHERTLLLEGVRVNRTVSNAGSLSTASQKVPRIGHTQLHASRCKVMPLTAAQLWVVKLLPSILWRLEHVVRAAEVAAELQEMHPAMTVADPIQAEVLSHAKARCLAVGLGPGRAPRGPFNYERLEYLGDAVLKLLSAAQACVRDPDGSEGSLTRIAQRWQTNKHLYECGKRFPLRGSMLAQAFTNKKSLTAMRVQSVSVKEQADVIEALLGAVFHPSYNLGTDIQSAMNRAWLTFRLVVLGDDTDAVASEALTVDHFSALVQTIDMQRSKSTRMPSTKKQCLPPLKTELAEVARALGYTFQDEMLLAAITRRELGGTGSRLFFQRLEFLGDALLQALVSRYLVQNFPELDEGGLSQVRVALVCNRFLARRLVRRFGEATGRLFFQERTMRRKVERYSSDILNQFSSGKKTSLSEWDIDFVIGSSGNHDLQAAATSRSLRRLLGALHEETEGHTGCVEGPKTVADIYEALMAAVLLDVGGDMAKLWQVFACDFEVPGALVKRQLQAWRMSQLQPAVERDSPLTSTFLANTHAMVTPKVQAASISAVPLAIVATASAVASSSGDPEALSSVGNGSSATSGIWCSFCETFVSAEQSQWETHGAGIQHQKRIGNLNKDGPAAISRLERLKQSGKLELSYDMDSGKHGPPHRPEFAVEVHVQTTTWSLNFEGRVGNKKVAKGIAAFKAMEACASLE